MMINHQMKGGAMCWACSTHEAEKREMRIAFLYETQRKETAWKTKAQLEE
jgi:hypothetical protein